MDRKTLQNLAKSRIKDAKALLGRRRWSAAYYLCGYAMECALKSCLLRYLGESGAVFGDEKYLRRLTECWTHDLVKLVSLAGLDAEFGIARSTNAALDNYWNVAKGWEEISRYEDHTETAARALHEAVTHNPDGVLRWIQLHW